MTTTMKQSLLSFGRTAPRAKMAEAIVIDNSDDEGISTPPRTPPPPQTTKQYLTEPLVEVLANQASSSSSSSSHSPERAQILSSKEQDKTSKPNKKTKETTQKKLHSELLPDALPALMTKERLAADIALAGEKAKFGEESIICHQHRGSCTNLLRCTVRKADGRRCKTKYCYSILQRLYRQSPEQIMKAGRNILGMDVTEHVRSDEAKYLWKCPKCRGTCQCSSCRKGRGLAPLGPIHDVIELSEEANGTATTTSKKKMKRPAGDGESAVDRKDKKSKKGTNDGASAPSALEMGFAKATTDEAKVLKLQEHVQEPKVSKMQQQTFQKPLREPKPVDTPQLSVMKSRLPVANILERIWLYETLVRFDCIGLPKGLLCQLDKFDDWTEGQVHMMLHKLICRIAEVKSSKATPLRNIHKKVVAALEAVGSDLTRGDAWEAARSLCISSGMAIPELEEIDILQHQQGGLTIKQAPAETTPSLLQGRLTRSRRQAELVALEKVKAISAQDLEDSEDEFSVEDEEEEDFEEDGLVVEEEEDAPRGSGRKNKVGDRRSTRLRVKLSSAISVSDEDEDDAVDEERAQREVEIVGEDESRGDTSSVVSDNTVPSPAPSFETRIAILSRLAALFVQGRQAKSEIDLGLREAQILEREGKEEEKELLRQHDEEMKAMEDRAPSMADESFSQWKEDKTKLRGDHAFALLDLRVHTYLQTETRKSRTGPLGIDSDGVEYWQLSEFVETKPSDTTGRWAWSLLVLGNMPLTFVESATDSRISMVTQATPHQSEVGVRSDDGIWVEIEGPARKPVKDNGEGKTDRLTNNMEVDEGSVTNRDGFYGTNDPQEIARLIEYIRYRLTKHEFVELQALRKQEEAEAAQGSRYAAVDASMGNAVTPTETSVRQLTTASLSMRRESEDLRETHSRRRKQVDALIKKLDLVRQYFQWYEEG